MTRKKKQAEKSNHIDVYGSLLFSYSEERGLGKAS